MAPAGTELVLVPPAPVASVGPAQAAIVVPVDPAVAEQLEDTADAFVESLVALNAHSPAFTGKVGSITRMGDREMREAAAVSNRMLDRPVKAMGSGLFDSGSPVSKSLIDLRNTIEELDPARQGDLFSPRKLLGMIPLGSKLRDYFDRYRSSQTHLDAIINALYRGQDELRKDNAAIEQEKVGLWATMGRLQQYALMAARLDQALEERILGLEATDPERARVLRQDVQFYIRQKHQDLLTQLAVAVQGYLDLVRKNNAELVKGVDRATTTTVAALRTAVMVAQALANQPRRLQLRLLGAGRRGRRVRRHRRRPADRRHRRARADRLLQRADADRRQLRLARRRVR
ncbi:MAG: toxic anion resistance protein, partial [Nocardioidaceae bacterium]